MSKTVEYNVNEAGTAARVVITNETDRDYKIPSSARVAELADILVSHLRQHDGGMVYAALSDKNDNRRLVISIAEYENVEDNTLLFEALDKISSAITDNKAFRVEVE